MINIATRILYFNGMRDHGDLACSSDGVWIFILAEASVGLVWSDDSGVTWNTALPSWYTGIHGSDFVRCSASGAVVLVGAGGASYVSTDYGSTWTQVPNTGGHSATGYPVISSDGTYLAIAVGDGLIVSTDSGSTWSYETAGHLDLGPLACSSDGQRLIAPHYTGTERTGVSQSTDYGATWTDITSSVTGTGSWWKCAASNASGTLLLLGGEGGTFVSTDFGATWNAYTQFVFTDVCAISGAVLQIGLFGGVYLSDDAGLTWAQVDPGVDIAEGVELTNPEFMVPIIDGFLAFDGSGHYLVRGDATLQAVFLDGFDYYTDPAVGKWSSVSNATISATSGRDGTGGIEPSGAMVLTTSTGLPSFYSSMGFSLKRVSGAAITIDFNCTGWAETEYTITINASGTITSNGEESASAIATGTWVNVEIGVFHHVSDGTVRVLVDGTEYHNQTGVATELSGSVDAVVLSCGTSGACILDDFYYISGGPLVFPGKPRVKTLSPDGNSTPQDWTPDTGNAWERVAATAGYISSDTAGNESRFTVENAGAVGTVHGVQINALAVSPDASPHTVAVLYNANASAAASVEATEVHLRNAYRENPDTVAAWVKADVDAMTNGVNLVS